MIGGAPLSWSPMFSRRTSWSLTPNLFTEVVQEVRASGKEILDLTVSNPTRAGIEYDSAAILDSLRNLKSLDYDPQPKGMLSEREAVAAYYSDHRHQRGIFLCLPFTGQSRRRSVGAEAELSAV